VKLEASHAWVSIASALPQRMLSKVDYLRGA
jgi:hypothetical protein